MMKVYVQRVRIHVHVMMCNECAAAIYVDRKDGSQ